MGSTPIAGTILIAREESCFMTNTLVNLLPIILIFVLMYFLMIRPQKKKDKQIKDMRNSLTVGDEIITIGGLCGKIVKTKDETIVVQVGADKVKFEMMRWAVSTVTKESAKRGTAVSFEEEDEPKKVMPKKLRKSSDVEEAEKAEKAKEEVKVEVAEAPEEKVTEEVLEEAVEEAAVNASENE